MERAAAIAARWASLAGLWPYSSLKQVGAARAFERLAKPFLLKFGEQEGQSLFRYGRVELLYAKMPWDSAFFGLPTVRLYAALFGDDVSRMEITAALAQLAISLRTNGTHYAFAEVGATDPRLLGALGEAGWSVVETRLHYYHDQLNDLPSNLPRGPVRAAVASEAEEIRCVSAQNRNIYDRFHADPAFTSEQADAFLGEYAAAAVHGYCDVVLVPTHEFTLDSFLALSHLDEVASQLEIGLGRVVLTAVGPANRGWHRRLVAEALRYTAGRGGAALLMTTQATNQAVIHNAEQLGMRLGGTTHIVSRQL